MGRNDSGVQQHAPPAMSMRGEDRTALRVSTVLSSLRQRSVGA
jgi:hypothetical protein